MHYFFKESAILEAEREITLEAEDVNHAYRVLRLRKGAAVVVADGRGAAYHGIIVSITPGEVVVWLVEPAQNSEPALKVTLLQSLAKGEKMDLVIRQAVELGVSRIIPVLTERSIPRLTGSREAARLLRWQKIARSAAAQCRRAFLPPVEPICDLDKVLKEIPGRLALIPWEHEHERGLADLLWQIKPGNNEVLLFTGPEGGFSSAEIEALCAAGAKTVHLGPRI
ncbi:MAG TPA: 16S rRNA (uracil(1498)-N(3))-methyltransferase, partial [Bacillota bacterium]|nr:16S rRNA (uracil(1498)-N(3))-methyltransferase [Bacillota bacterium]